MEAVHPSHLMLRNVSFGHGKPGGKKTRRICLGMPYRTRCTDGDSKSSPKVEPLLHLWASHGFMID